jgi:hypothetical protein
MRILSQSIAYIAPGQIAHAFCAWCGGIIPCVKLMTDALPMNCADGFDHFAPIDPAATQSTQALAVPQRASRLLKNVLSGSSLRA